MPGEGSRVAGGLFAAQHAWVDEGEVEQYGAGAVHGERRERAEQRPHRGRHFA